MGAVSHHSGNVAHSTTLFCASLVAIALSACTPDEQIGVNDPDASMLDSAGGIDAAPDAAACSCDASSCGTRICGRSDCGFPCGECEPDEFCFVGTQCQAGVGPGTPCVDAFGDRVWEGDRGFRACPTDPGDQQECTCTGGGADAWASCDAACVDICAQTPAGITCGAPGCTVGSEVCCIPSAASDDRTCVTGTCPGSNYTRACDGPEDCAGGICCGGDNLWTATCVTTGTCAPLEQFCHTGADCPGGSPFCCPALAIDVRTCSATQVAGCT